MLYKRQKKLRITKKNLKRIPPLTMKNNYLFVELKNIFFFLLRNKQLVKKIYCDMKEKRLSKLHKKEFKKRKKRVYVSQFLTKLELRLSGLLYINRLISKPKLLKQLILHGYILINKHQVKRGLQYKIHPNDILTIHENMYYKFNEVFFDKIIKKFYRLKFLSVLSFNKSIHFTIHNIFLKNHFLYHYIYKNFYYIYRNSVRKNNTFVQKDSIFVKLMLLNI
jgi:ribosomal protein S4